MDNVDELIERGITFLEGRTGTKDYEQAYYYLNEAQKLGSKAADELLTAMRENSLGVRFEGDGYATSNDDNGLDDDHLVSIEMEFAPQSETANEPLLGNPNRCIACGMETLMPSTVIHGAKYCIPQKGGCGSNILLPIEECGLKRGVALQPYTEKRIGGMGSAHSTFGSFIHTLKYGMDIDDSLKENILKEIAKRIIECDVISTLTGGSTSTDITIVPAPSSKKRKLQPVYKLAQLISAYGYHYSQALTKRSNVESKNRPSGTELAPGDVTCNGSVNGKIVLLIDDTYGEGATLRACLRALKEKNAHEVYFLSLCKNLYGGVKGSSPNDNDIH